MITSDHPLYFLASRITPEKPDGFEAVTRPIKLKSEIEIVQSVWETIRHTECLVTIDSGKLVFWRRPHPNPQAARERNRRSVKNYVQCP